VNADVLDEYAEVYVLSYYEENEESLESLRWNIADAVAYQLVQ